jgi:hypothetical protein
MDNSMAPTTTKLSERQQIAAAIKAPKQQPACLKGGDARVFTSMKVETEEFAGEHEDERLFCRFARSGVSARQLTYQVQPSSTSLNRSLLTTKKVGSKSSSAISTQSGVGPHSCNN